jgi:hypothetical protein
MPAFRVYFMDGKSIIAADTIEAETHDNAANSAVRAMGSYQWAGKLAPNRVEVWQGEQFRYAGPILHSP